MIWTLLTAAWAQTLLAMAKPGDADLWGYIDTQGTFVIPAQHQKLFPFGEDGYAHLYDKKRKSFVFIDPRGQELKVEAEAFVLQNVFGFGTVGFDDGMAPIGIGKKWGWIDTSGKVAIPAKYDDVTRFGSGHAAALLGKTWYVVDKAGKETEVPGVLEIRRFEEGLAPVKDAAGLFGFVDGTGAKVIAPQFKSVGYFVDGLAWAKTAEGTVGFIDPKGTWVIPAKFLAAKEFGRGTGLARVREGETWTYVKADGTLTDIVTKAGTTDVQDFSEGLAAAKKGELHGFIDSTGAWAIEPSFQGVRDFKNGYAAAKQGETWGFVDMKGNWVVKPTLSGVRDFEKTE